MLSLSDFFFFPPTPTPSIYSSPNGFPGMRAPVAKRQQVQRGFISTDYCYHLSSLIFGATWQVWPACTVNRFSLTTWHVKASISGDCHLKKPKSLSWRAFIPDQSLFMQRSPQYFSNPFRWHLGTPGYPDTTWRPWRASSITTFLATAQYFAVNSLYATL